MQVVVDTNILVSGIFWKGLPLKILELWIEDKISIVASPVILNEYMDIIEKLQKHDIELSKLWKDFIFENINLITPGVSLDLCRDKKDNMFLDCALSANAFYLISGDSDLLELKDIFDIPIVTAREFLKIFDKK